MKDTSGGHSNIPSKVFKVHSNLLSAPLSVLINQCIGSASFPDCLKIAQVIPLFKSKNKLDVRNFRPISMLPILAKIFEKFIYDQLIEFVELNGLLCHQQSGFRRNSSTSISIAKLLDKVIAGADEGSFGLCVFLDLQKAFDMVDHEILVQKLEYYGVRGQALDLFKSYLANRQLFVKLNNVSSKLSIISRGVPQGSTLSGLLFLLFINDLVNSSNKLFFNLFADDTSLYLKDRNLNALFEVMNDELVKVSNWLSANKLSLNVSKTTYILFKGKKQIRNTPQLYIFGNPISKVDSTKFLGILIDENLNWKPQAKFVIGKLSRMIGVLSKVGENLNLSTLRTLYFSFIQPSLQYGVNFWFPVSKDLQNKIFRLQKKAVRIISRANFGAHTNPLFSRNKILKLEDLYYLETCKFIHQEVNFCHNFNLVRQSSLHSYSTRFNENLIPRNFRTKFGSNFILCRGVNNYNNLCNEIKNLDSMDKFKCCLKLLLSDYGN